MIVVMLASFESERGMLVACAAPVTPCWFVLTTGAGGRRTSPPPELVCRQHRVGLLCCAHARTFVFTCARLPSLPDVAFANVSS